MSGGQKGGTLTLRGKERMNITKIIGQFDLAGTLQSLTSNKEGLINNTYISTFVDERGVLHRYTHQRLNRTVFPNPEAVMTNILLVTDHLRRKVADRSDAERRCLVPVPTKQRAWWAYDEQGELWRTYHYIGQVQTYSFLRDSSLAQRFGRAVATFQADLADFPSDWLTQTIPNFHHMGVRYEQFETAVAEDRAKRLGNVGEEVAFFTANKERAMGITEALERGTIPLRVTHNDTKVNNVLFDEVSGEGLCMIDLDTVMGGSALFDTGDMIRTGCITAAEDEPDLQKVRFDLDLFRGLIGGYRSVADTFLTEAERSLLGESGRAITLIMGLRMLTDYLVGDQYYRVAYPEHNLTRARTQIKLIKEMDRHWDQIQTICHASSHLPTE